MPTGYTAGVEDGSVTDFRVFAMNCAHAFFYDCPISEKFPEEYKPDDYHDKQHKALASEVVRVQEMTDKQCENMAQAEHAEYQRMRDDSLKSVRVKNDRYRTMRAKVADWIPPTKDHTGLKKFMLEQIDMCLFDEKDYGGKASPLKSAGEWRKDAVRRIEKEIEYHRTEYLKEVEQCRSSTEWVRELKKSLIPEEK